VETTGIELRPTLVQEMQGIARRLGEGFDGLQFQEGDIQDLLATNDERGVVGQGVAQRSGEGLDGLVFQEGDVQYLLAEEKAIIGADRRGSNGDRSFDGLSFQEGDMRDFTDDGNGALGAGQSGADGDAFREDASRHAELIHPGAAPELDVLVALHACDTATDDALYFGITRGARVLLTAPCCHKEIRRQMDAQRGAAGGSQGREPLADSGAPAGIPPGVHIVAGGSGGQTAVTETDSPSGIGGVDSTATAADATKVVPGGGVIHPEGGPAGESARHTAGGGSASPQQALRPMLRHGIFRERMAEMVTDSVRALLLELAGYEVRVFEFVGGEHTAKNVMLAATKRRERRTEAERAQIRAELGVQMQMAGATRQRLAERMGELGGGRGDKMGGGHGGHMRAGGDFEVSGGQLRGVGGGGARELGGLSGAGGSERKVRARAPRKDRMMPLPGVAGTAGRRRRAASTLPASKGQGSP
jgi:hypothetical protein